MSLDFSFAIPVGLVIALLQIIKAYLPTGTAPVFAMAIAFILNAGYMILVQHDTAGATMYMTFLSSIVEGLSACGLYDVATKTFRLGQSPD